MNRKIIRREGKARLGLMAMLAILLALISTVPGLAQSGPNTMNFQGRLLDNSGNPLGGVTRCMRFRMCSDSGCTTQVWPGSGYEYHAVTTESGTYKAGLFTVTLGDSVNYTDYPIEPTLLYDYDTLYLEIEVSAAFGTLCDTRTDYDTMTPRSQLRANAYAQRSRRVRNQEDDDTYLMSVTNTGQGGGMYGETDSTTSAAAAGYFLADGESGATYGVYAQNDSTSTDAAAGHFAASGYSGATRGVLAENYSKTDDARAGYFYAISTSGRTYGVYAVNNSMSTSAAAGYFLADGDMGQTYGVWAENDSTSNNATAAYFKADGNSGVTRGVVVQNNSATDGATAGYFFAYGSSGQTYGVYARTDSPGTGAAAGYFETTATSGATYGVYGKNPSTTDDARAGYFEATGTSGQTYGVYAENDSTSRDAAAGYFDATGTTGWTYGVHAENSSTGDFAAAGYFYATGSSGQTKGVFAQNDSTSTDAAAGYFHANGDSGQTTGVYAKNDSTSNGATAGHFNAEGDSGETMGVYAEIDSTSNGAAAGQFIAFGGSGQTYGVWLQNRSTDSSSVGGYFYAKGGIGLMARSESANIIEAYTSGTERRFYVNNSGDVYIDGTYYDTGADFAEMLPGVDGLEPGDVLIIASDGQLTRSTEAYASTVVGVYSTKPAFVGGSDEEMKNPGKVPLAITGIAPVKTSAENGPIRPGDLLTTSPTPGHAMRADPEKVRPGTILGKALESWDEDTGTILVLVTLQ